MKKYRYKGVKIKHYNRSYRVGSRRFILTAVGKWLAVVVLLVAIGFFAGRPVVQWLTTDNTHKEETSSTEQTPETSPEQEEETTQQADRGVVYMCSTTALATDEGIADAVQEAKLQGAGSVAIELKITGGQVLYQSAVLSVTACGAQSASAIDLSKVVQAFAAENIEVLGMVSAYHDNLYARYDRSSATRYDDSDVLWLDNTAQNNGQPWLAPGAEGTDAYLGSICEEIMDMGVKGIILTDAQLPTAVYWEHASTGFESGQSNLDGMQAAIDLLAQRVHAKGGSFSLYYEAQTLLSDSVSGLDYKQLKADTIYVNTQLQTGTVVGSTTISENTTYQQKADAVQNALSGKVSNMVLSVYTGVSVTGEQKLIWQ